MANLVPKRVIVHHSLTKDSGTVSWGAIRKYHTQTMKWTGIGYHAGVEQIMSGGELNYEVLMGRMWDRKGAHVRGHNHNSLSICFVGNYDKIAPRKEMLEAGAKIIALWLKLYGLTIDDIYTHHNFDIHKSCPGKMFDMEYLKMLVQKIKGG
ncbi:MAG: N-acetylmuramoyl-L-alanine amidase [Desulfobacteraceae bacterium]|nr:N-acetylmuramoyl-L-alanine amidase [Desulfobacteraceae bacterium]